MERISLSLECPICYSTLVDPRILPCAHTFCINCIVSMCDGVDDTRCPVCRAVAIVPINGGRGFPTNYLVANLLEQIQAATNSKMNARLCQGRHAAMEVALYCITCEEMICHKCAYDNHPKRRHKCVAIETAAETIRSQLLKSCSLHEREEAVAAKTRLYDQQSDFEVHAQSVIDEIKEFYDSISGYIQRRRNALLRTVDSFTLNQQDALDKKLEEAQNIIQEYDDREEILSSLFKLEDVELISKMRNQQPFREIAVPELTVPLYRMHFDIVEGLREQIDKFCSLQSDKTGSMEEMEIDDGRGFDSLKDNRFESNTNINIIIQNNYSNNSDNNSGDYSNNTNNSRNMNELENEIENELDELDQLEQELEQELASQDNQRFIDINIMEHNENAQDEDENEDQNENEDEDEDENEGENENNEDEDENDVENDSEDTYHQDYENNDNTEHDNDNTDDTYSYSNNENESDESESYLPTRLSSNEADFDDDTSSSSFTSPSSVSSISSSPSRPFFSPPASRVRGRLSSYPSASSSFSSSSSSPSSFLSSSSSSNSANNAQFRRFNFRRTESPQKGSSWLTKFFNN